MREIGTRLETWQASLVANVSIGSLLARNPIAHKWKTTFRCLMLRETVFWRLHDLLSQSHLLHSQGHQLGARVLLRSAFETLATLIYLNQHIEQVLEEKLDFHVFDRKATALLLGSRNWDEAPKSINIMTVLEKCEKRYPGLLKLYAALSESVHPSYEGLCMGYSKVDHDAYETNFSNRWMEVYAGSHANEMDLCMTTFEYEYDDVWRDRFESLEKWIEANDARLEATKY